jgi:hypothetical protein
MLHFDGRLDPAANVEVAFHLQEARIDGIDQVIGDPVRDRFVERPFVAE